MFGGMTAEDRKAQIVRAARSLFQERGYPGFSYADLEAQLGIRKASIHHHFRTKDALAVAIAQSFLTEIMHDFGELEAEHAGPVERFEGLLTIYAKRFRNGSHMCPFGSMTAGWAHVPEEMKRHFHQIYQSAIHWVSQLLADGVQSGDFHFTGTPTAMATLLLAALQGGAQIAIAEGDDAFETITRQTHTLLGISPKTP